MVIFSAAVSTAALSTFLIAAFKYSISRFLHNCRKVTKGTKYVSLNIGLR
jgi:hypothetical protein